MGLAKARPNYTDVVNLGEELWYMCAWMIHDVCKENSSIIMSNARSLEWLNYHEMCRCTCVAQLLQDAKERKCLVIMTHGVWYMCRCNFSETAV